MFNTLLNGRRQTVDECLIVLRKNPESAAQNALLVLNFLRQLKTSREFIKFTVSRFHRAVRLLQTYFRTQLRRFAAIQQNALDKWRWLEMRKATKAVSVFTCLRDESNDEDSVARRQVVLQEFRKHRTAFAVRWRTWRKTVLGLEAQLSLTQEELIRLKARGAAASVMGVKALQDRVAYITTRLENMQLQRPVLSNMEININALEVRAQQLTRLAHTDKVHGALRQLGIRSEDPRFVETVVRKYEEIVEKERAAKRKKSVTSPAGQQSPGSVPLWLYRGSRPHRPAQRPDLLQALGTVPRAVADKAFDLMYHRHVPSDAVQDYAKESNRNVHSLPITFVSTGFADRRNKEDRQSQPAAESNIPAVVPALPPAEERPPSIDPKTAHLLESLGMDVGPGSFEVEGDPFVTHSLRLSSHQRPMSARTIPSPDALSPRRALSDSMPSKPIVSPRPQHHRPVSAKELASRLKVIRVEAPQEVRPPVPPPRPSRSSTLRAEEKRSNLTLPLSKPFTLEVAPSFIEQQVIKKIGRQHAERMLHQAEHEHIMKSEMQRLQSGGPATSSGDVLRVGCATVNSAGLFTFDGVPAAQLHEQNMKSIQAAATSAATAATAAAIAVSSSGERRGWAQPNTVLEQLPSSLEVRRPVSALRILEFPVPRGVVVVCGCTDGLVRAWSLQTAAELCNDSSCSDRVGVLSAIGSSSEWVCAGSDDGTVRVFGTTSAVQWALQFVIRTTHWINDLAPIGTSCVAVCSFHSNIPVYDLDLASSTPRSQKKKPAAEPDGAAEKSPTLVLVLEGHQQGVTCCTTCSATQNIVSGSLDGTAKVWKLDRSRITIAGFEAPPTSTLVQQVGSDFAANIEGEEDQDDLLDEFAFDALYATKSFTGHSAGILRLIELSPMTFLTASLDGTLRAWDVRSLDTIYRIAAPCSMMTSMTALRLLQSTPSATQQVLITCSDGTNAVFHLASGRTLSKIVTPDSATSCAHIAGQDLVVLGGSKGAVVCAKASTGQPVAWYPGPARNSAITVVAVHGDVILVGGEDRQLHMYRVPVVKDSGRKLTGHMSNSMLL